MFNAKKVKNDLVQWIRDWFRENGPGCTAVVGTSGGKDSSVVAALCVEALGKDRVLGVMMPQGYQKDRDVAIRLIRHLGIRHITANIIYSVDEVLKSIPTYIRKFGDNGCEIIDELNISSQTRINLPPRIRMATLYAISQSVNGRVSNNCNLSEDYVGYSTRWGDSVGDFAPLANLTVTEVKAIGYELGLPDEFIEKVPSDGLCGKTDEDNLGFSYDTLDKYIRTGVCEDSEAKAKIDMLHKKNMFKLKPIPYFEYCPSMFWDDVLGTIEEG
jgi:NAD+ synthase